MTLRISKLTKVYDNGVKALDELTLEAGPGLFGLLGPNGAGKSTLMRTIATLQQPGSGGITFEDIDVLKDPKRLRQALGYLPQEFGVYPGVSAERLLDYLARLKGVADRKERKRLVEQVLDITNLYELRKAEVHRFSGGMKQRFGIAQLLLNNPRLIIVDEPTAGLDPAERKRFLNLLREVGTQCTAILSTHLVDDVRGLCNEMAIIHNGRVVKQGRPAEALRELNGKAWSRTIAREQLQGLESNYFVLSAHYRPDGEIEARVYASEQPGPGFEATEPLLEDVYFLALRSA
ncbi:MAG: ABC transporter ATP-binding protein [Phaeodactylibacter sp.]|nr:ABC transporter ATP-binding protein [Phaeodactylibacter sp.]MCB9276796.1 ABC transporter ATP-binding protein [Lewinellaceae bacterium]